MYSAIMRTLLELLHGHDQNSASMNLAYDVHDFSAIQERYHILDQRLRRLALGSQPC